jgi:flagellar basal-body rod modification protein FlgD
MIDPVVNTFATKSEQSSKATDKASEIANTFYKLLTTQIQYQDPLNPMENTEFTSQLAQLSSVEQLQGVNKNLTYLQLYMASINNSQALSFIGKEVNASGNTVYWDGTNSPTMNYSLSGDAARVVVNIYDQNNNLVRTYHQGEQKKGEQSFTWENGLDNDGDKVGEGIYKFSVLATNADGNAVNSTTMLSGRVEGLTFEEGVTYVIVNGQKVAIGDIISIKGIQEQEQVVQQTGGSTPVTTLKTLGKAALTVAPFVL